MGQGEVELGPGVEGDGTQVVRCLACDGTGDGGTVIVLGEK
tara:strand:- start:177 stop:299 length:123 start_codon:yes stop_codon:yes gene_type:complete